MTLKQRISRLLEAAEEPLTVSEIAASVSATRSGVRRALKRLERLTESTKRVGVRSHFRCSGASEVRGHFRDYGFVNGYERGSGRGYLVDPHSREARAYSIENGLCSCQIGGSNV